VKAVLEPAPGTVPAGILAKNDPGARDRTAARPEDLDPEAASEAG
jgi:hypothetical protein